jgi:hypothetical protein
MKNYPHGSAVSQEESENIITVVVIQTGKTATSASDQKARKADVNERTTTGI